MDKYNLEPCADELRVRDRVYGVRSSSSISTMIGRVVAIDPDTHLYRVHFTERTIYGEPSRVGDLRSRLSSSRYQWIDRVGLHHFEACPDRPGLGSPE
jgi:hypothetical protein